MANALDPLGEYNQLLARNQNALLPGTGAVGMARNRLAADARNPRPWLDRAATATMAVPGLGDVLGLASDAAYMTANEEARTPANFGLAALGALPFVPGITNKLRPLLDDPEKLRDVPNVPQSNLERFAPPKGDPETIARLYEPENVERVQRLARQGAEAGGLSWYNTEPLRLAAIDVLGEAEGNAFHRAFMNRVAATSPRSTVSDNIKRASYFQTRHAQGVPVDVMQQPPKPYGHLAHKTHAPMIETLDQGGEFAPLKQPKASSFAENLSGNYAPVTADAHLVRGIGLQKKSGKPETGAPSNTQYRGVEEFGKRMAAELGMEPAQFQSSLWMGAAEETGVRNPQIFMQAFNDSLEKTAAARNITATQALRDFLRGKAPLLGLSGTAAIVANGLYGSEADDDGSM